MSASILWSLAPQGSNEWLSARRGVITASRAKDARDFKAPTKKQADAGITRGEPTAKRTGYAMDLARERVGGKSADVFQNAAMRLGSEQEAVARQAYEDRTGFMVEEVGFAFTEDGRYGVSVDGFILRPNDGGRRRVWECKTMVSSDTLFTAVIDGDISAYRDQCLFAMWMLTAEAVELYLHVWDIPELSRVIVIERNEAEIQALEDDLIDFEREVSGYESKLLKAMGYELPKDAQPATTPAAPTGDIAIGKLPWGVAAPASTPNNAPAELADANF